MHGDWQQARSTVWGTPERVAVLAFKNRRNMVALLPPRMHTLTIRVHITERCLGYSLGAEVACRWGRLNVSAPILLAVVPVEVA